MLPWAELSNFLRAGLAPGIGFTVAHPKMKRRASIVTDRANTTLAAVLAKFIEALDGLFVTAESDIHRRPIRMSSSGPSDVSVVGLGSPPIIDQTGLDAFFLKLLNQFDGANGMFPGSFIRVNQLMHLGLTVGALKHVLAGRVGADQLLTPRRVSSGGRTLG